MPQLRRQGMSRGGNKSERLQVSMCLPNDRDFDTWYEAVFGLPIAWRDVTDIGTHYFKRTSANQLHIQLGVPHMCWTWTPLFAIMDLFSLGSSYIEFLCGTLPRYRAFAIHSYFQTVVIPKIMVPLLSCRSNPPCRNKWCKDDHVGILLEQPAVTKPREIGGVSRPIWHPPFSVKLCPQQLMKKHMPLLPFHATSSSFSPFFCFRITVGIFLTFFLKYLVT